MACCAGGLCGLEQRLAAKRRERVRGGWVRQETWFRDQGNAEHPGNAREVQGLGLERVSDLSFVLNGYLTGAAGLSMIRIESFADDE